jgi:succinate-acetate transporter protein
LRNKFYSYFKQDFGGAPALCRLTLRAFGSKYFSNRAGHFLIRETPIPDLTTIQVKDGTANPAPLGLFGFGMTTVLLNMHNAGFYDMNSMILAMGLCYGGAAQVIAGIFEWKKGATFGATAFISYGFFWLSLVAVVLLPKIFPEAKLKSDDAAMAAYLAIWGLFTLGLFIGTFRLSVALQVVFGTLVILFFMLSYGEAFKVGAGFKHFTGFEGIVCGLAAMYTGIAQILNEVFGKTVLPLGIVKKA